MNLNSPVPKGLKGKTLNPGRKFKFHAYFCHQFQIPTRILRLTGKFPPRPTGVDVKVSSHQKDRSMFNWRYFLTLLTILMLSRRQWIINSCVVMREETMSGVGR